MELVLTPEDLVVISARQSAQHFSLSSVVGGASVPAIAGGAAAAAAPCDLVSKLVWAALGAHHEAFFGATTAPGLVHMLAGAEILLPVSSDYQISDVMGGCQISAQGPTANR